MVSVWTAVTTYMYECHGECLDCCNYVFDYHADDVFWCTADLGWITGHTYVCYGPLANAATSVMVSVWTAATTCMCR